MTNANSTNDNYESDDPEETSASHVTRRKDPLYHSNRFKFIPLEDN